MKTSDKKPFLYSPPAGVWPLHSKTKHNLKIFVIFSSTDDGENQVKSKTYLTFEQLSSLFLQPFSFADDDDILNK